MNMYFFAAAAAAVLSLGGIILLIMYLVRTNPKNQPGYGGGNYGGGSYGGGYDNSFDKVPEEKYSERYEPPAENDDIGYTQLIDDDGLTQTVDTVMITFTNVETGEKIEKEICGVLSIGRNPGNDFVINDQRTSGKHCRISDENGRLYIEDLSSRNGTKVNGEQIVGRRELNNGDSVQFGKVRYMIGI